MHWHLRPQSRLLPNYRHVYGSLAATRLSAPRATLSTSAASYKEDDHEVKAARHWFANFTPETVPASICELSFSRASGPGGQNVNNLRNCLLYSRPEDVVTFPLDAADYAGDSAICGSLFLPMHTTKPVRTRVNSKATLRVPLGALLPLLPPLLHSEIRASRYCKAGSDSIVIQADESRKQKENSHQCFVKLHQLIVAAAKLAIPGETSDAQLKRVKDLQQSANEQRLKAKKFASSKKTARRGTSSGDG